MLRKRRRWLISAAPAAVMAFGLLAVAPAPFGIAWRHATTVAGWAFGLGAVVAIAVYPLAAVCVCLWTFLGPEPRGNWLNRLRLAGLFGLGVIFAVVAALAILLLTEMVSRWQNRQIALRAAPLIAAIERYHHDHGEYPPALSDLRPDYLIRVPQTGTLSPTHYEYSRARTTAVSATPVEVPPYHLWVALPSPLYLDEPAHCLYLSYCPGHGHVSGLRSSAVGLPDEWELLDWEPSAP
jgi:hypothetical protein